MKKKIMAVLIHGELILMSLVVLVPILWIVLASFQEGNALSSGSLIPQRLTVENYQRLLSGTGYPVWFRNTFTIAVVNAVVSVTMILLTAWVLSRFDFRGKRTGLMAMLLLSMFPSFLSMTALYTLFLVLGLLGKPLAIVIIYCAGAIPYNTWLVKGYLDGISKSIDEAAYIDGCSRLQSFFKIVLPVSKPIMTYCLVSQFMAPWMDYILPNLLLSSKDESKTLAVGLYSMIQGQEQSNFTMFAAGSVLVAVPISILFLFTQNYLVQGISAGANKG